MRMLLKLLIKWSNIEERKKKCHKISKADLFNRLNVSKLHVENGRVCCCFSDKKRRLFYISSASDYFSWLFISSHSTKTRWTGSWSSVYMKAFPICTCWINAFFVVHSTWNSLRGRLSPTHETWNIALHLTQAYRLTCLFYSFWILFIFLTFVVILGLVFFSFFLFAVHSLSLMQVSVMNTLQA